MKQERRGGKRKNAGRPCLDPNGETRAKRYISCTKAEYSLLMEYLKQLRMALEADSSDYYD